jgi:hypothetical protein
MKYLVPLITILTITGTLIAADITGNWAGTVSTPKGDYPISFSFKTEGAKVQGTMLGTDGTPFKIENGQLENDNLTFVVTLNYPGKSISRTYKGKVSGDEIKFTVDSSGQTSEFTVKRVK